MYFFGFGSLFFLSKDGFGDFSGVEIVGYVDADVLLLGSSLGVG